MVLSESPTRDDFLANDLRVMGACGICFEPFNADHVPVAFGRPESCRHTFGNHCLQQWLRSTNENANKCPTCRQILFLAEPTTYVAEEESYDNESSVYSEDLNHDSYDNYYSYVDNDTAMDEELQGGQAVDSSSAEEGSETLSNFAGTLDTLFSAANALPFAGVQSENPVDDHDSVHENKKDDEPDTPARLQDITDPVMAHDFIGTLAHRLKTDGCHHMHRVCCLESMCHAFGMEIDQHLVGNQRAAMIQLLKDLAKQEVPESFFDSRLQGSYVSRLGALVGWQLD